MDFTLFNHSLYGTLDFYRKKTTDLLTLVTYVSAAGEGSSHWANGASMENKGVEFLLGYRGKTASGFTYDFTGNISANRNKITSLPESAINTYGGNGADDTILGRSIWSHYGYIAEGLFPLPGRYRQPCDTGWRGSGPYTLPQRERRRQDKFGRPYMDRLIRPKIWLWA